VSPLRAIAVAGLLAAAGCSIRSSVNTLLPTSPKPDPLEGEWAEKRDAATRRDLVYDGLKHRATVTATHLSLAVREARARRLAAWFGWTPVELEKWLAEERKAAATTEEFEVAFYTAEPRYNNLDGLRSDWRVTLKVDGADLLAKRVVGVDRDAATLMLFPFIGPFDIVYRVIAPIPQAGPVEGRPYVLELSSALGRLTLDYGKPPGPPATVNSPQLTAPPL
jgi:hypothetical protein